MATQTIALQTLDQDGRLDSNADGLEIQPIPELPPSAPNASDPLPRRLSNKRSAIVIAQLSGAILVNSFGSGLSTVGLPTMASALTLQDNLLLWPNAVYYLTSGSCLLLAGAAADVAGPRALNLIGCFLLAVFILACGLARTGIELVMFRAMQGIACALVVPTAISIISNSVESGKPWNIGFACIGLSMPLGFSLGLVLGGVFVSSIGWRAGYYVGGTFCFAVLCVGILTIPVDSTAWSDVPKRLRQEVDWVGALIASTSLALLSYVLATLSAKVQHITQGVNIAMLVVSIALIPAFVAWVQFQEKHSRPALIPNSLWKNVAFSSICIMVLLSIAVQNSMEQFCSLFFQEVQGTTALGASLRILPSLLLGLVLNVATGLFVNRVPLTYLIIVSTAFCAAAPLLMAVIDPKWPYWYNAFFAQLLAPLCGDTLFTIGILVVSDVFPARTQALAGAVFNTCAQLGTSIGLASMAVISSAVTNESRFANKTSPEALMAGYRASFWALFAWMALAFVVGVLGLRKLGMVGMKRD